MNGETKLFIVPTPIGNLKDITFRSVEIMKNSDYILCEDTRVSKKLLSHYKINKSLKTYHAHNEHKVFSKYVHDMKLGKQICLICDAGTPSISDPGYLLVKEAIKLNLKVECLPGPTALIPALVKSGLPSEKFVFEGFLPTKKGRKKTLNFLLNETRTMIFYESPKRLIKTIEEFKNIFGYERKVSISREISKIYEETINGSLFEVHEILLKKKIKGEIVIVLTGAKK
tara:strand:+ start:427 stop:1110 length:684 start_codon:yes stop_codon:yes gene_type:complete